jgi:hypothetical protein
MKNISSVRPLILAMLACASTGSQAVSFTQGDVTLDINGTINGFYVNRVGKSINRATGASTTTNNSALTNGLLPGWINLSYDPGQWPGHQARLRPRYQQQLQTIGLPIGNNAGGVGTTTRTTRSTPQYISSSATMAGALKLATTSVSFGQSIILRHDALGVGAPATPVSRTTPPSA